MVEACEGVVQDGLLSGRFQVIKEIKGEGHLKCRERRCFPSPSLPWRSWHLTQGKGLAQSFSASVMGAISGGTYETFAYLSPIREIRNMTQQTVVEGSKACFSMLKNPFCPP